MKKRASVFWLAFSQMAFLVLALFFVAPSVYASNHLPSGAFVVRPAKVEVSLLPGEEKTTRITLSNGATLPLAVSVSYEDIAPTVQTSSNDEPVVLLGTTGGKYPLKDLFTTPDSSFTILSGEEVSVPVTIRIPRNTEPGGRYGSVVFTFRPIFSGKATDATNVAVESRVASLFYVRVIGETKEEGRLAAFGMFNNVKTAAKPSLERPLQFQVAYENSGTVHLNPYGRMTLAPLIGESKTYTIDPLAVLPGETRMQEIAVRDSLRPGYYTAHLELNRGYQDIIDEQKVSIWILPSASEALVILLILAFIIWLIRRSLKLSRHALS